VTKAARTLAGATDKRPLTRGALVFIVRDIPRSCICVWDWDGHLAKWQMIKQLPGCPWHEGG
jgi:hypothetical protein